MKKIFLILLLFLSYSSFSQTIPKSKGYVSDYENIFTPEQNSQLTKLLLDYEKETTIEIAILTVPDFESDAADFAQKTAEKWGIGKKDINNGLLILMSKNKGVIRFQTGYGLEGYIPDGWLKHIGDSVISVSKNSYDIPILLIEKIKQRIGKEGYSQDHNKELIDKNKKAKSKEESPIEWMLTHMSWYWILIIVVLWFLLFLISPDTALWILFFALSKGESDSDSGSKGFGGGLFGGGGSTSSWK